MAVVKQIRTLMSKNFRLLLGRQHFLGTFMIAFLVPIALTALFSYAKNLFVPPAVYGIGDTRPIKTLPEALERAGQDGRNTVVFINNGMVGGQIDNVIGQVSGLLSDTDAKVVNMTSSTDLTTVCRSSLRGVSRCYGAVVFHSSPSEGANGTWNYTMRMDGALNALRIHIDETDNDAEVYLLPFKHAIDSAIARTTSNATELPTEIDSLPYTDMTKEERADEIVRLYQRIVINWMGVTLSASIFAITYHLTGFLSQEKENGMGRLIDAMMPTKKRWQGMCMRMFASHCSFSLIYLPGWIISALIIRQGVFKHTSFVTVIFFQILGGLSMSSFSVFASSFFKNAQLSGNTTIIFTALMAIIAQSITRPDTVTVAVLSVIFPPCTYVYFVIIMARFEYIIAPTDLVEIPPLQKSDYKVPGIAILVFLGLQIIVYPILGALVEHWLHGANSAGRQVVVDQKDIETHDLKDTALKITNFSKVYYPSRLNGMSTI